MLEAVHTEAGENSKTPVKRTSPRPGPRVHRYAQIADEITRAIQTGMFGVGDKLPSLRHASLRFAASVPTVLNAYSTLEARGLVTSRNRSGFYVLQQPRSRLRRTRLAEYSSPAFPQDMSAGIRRVFELANAGDLAPLATEGPSPELFPLRRLDLITARLVKQHGNRHGFHPDIQGIPSLRRQIAKRLLSICPTSSMEQIVITAGSTDGLFLCLRALTKAGDFVAVEAPTYYGHLLLLETLQLRALPIVVDPVNGLDLAELYSAARSMRIAAIVTTPNFANPTGALMPLRTRRQLIEFGAEHDVPIVEDDTNGDIHFVDSRPPTLKSLDSRGNVLYCGSFSKTLSANWRVGYVDAGRWRDAVLHGKFSTTFMVPELIQETVSEFLRTESFDRHMCKLRRILKENMQAFVGAVRRHFPMGSSASACRFLQPDGGHFLWVRLPQGMEAARLHAAALAAKVNVVPGTLFSNRGEYRDHIRLNCGRIFTDTIDEAVGNLGRIICRVPGNRRMPWHDKPKFRRQ